MSSDRFEIEPDYPERERSGWQSCLVGCLIVTVVLLVLGGIAVRWIWVNWRNVVADAGTEVFAKLVDQSELPDLEKGEVKAQINRLGDAFRENRIPPERIGMILEGFFESALFTSSVVMAVERKHFDQSELTDEEKEQGRKDLRRFVRGMGKQDHWTGGVRRGTSTHCYQASKWKLGVSSKRDRRTVTCSLENGQGKSRYRRDS